MLTEDKFADLTASLRCKPAVREALKAILVHGEKWADVVHDYGIPASTISRAMKRMGQGCCPYCGAHNIDKVLAKTD